MDHPDNGSEYDALSEDDAGALNDAALDDDAPNGAAALNENEGPAARQRRLRRGIRNDAFDREAEGFVPTDGLAWAVAHHPLGKTRLLTVNDPRAATPVNFNGELFLPQKTLLAAMLACERCPNFKVEDARANDNEWPALILTRMGRISEMFSFGKTVLALALVCSQRVPARLPDQQPLMTYPLVGAGARSINRAIIAANRGSGSYDPVGVGFLPEVTVRYSRFLPLTVVAASANVISQWENETRRFTNLRFFIIENVRSLREFEGKYHRGEVASLDLIFIKAGRVTTSFVVKGEPPHLGKSKNRSLFEAFARILEGVPVARFIIDDFDTLKLGSDDCFVPALFTWLISATRRQTNARMTLRVGHATLADFFRANLMTSFPILGAALDDVLNKAFSLHCAPEFVNVHINSTKIDFRRIYVRGGQAAAILRDLDVAEEIVEMINADAVGTAAQSLGIAAQSIGDVIQRVVGAHLDKLRHAVRALIRVADARNTLAAKNSCEKDREVVKKLRAALKDGSDAEAAEALAATAGLSVEVTTSLNSLEEWAAEQRDKHGKTLNRMRDNIREGECQCCKLPIERGDVADTAYVLAGCCQIIICEACIAPKAEGSNKKSFIKRCPNCLRSVNLKTGLVRIGAELDLEEALKDETVIGAVPDDPLEADPLEADPLEPDPKLKADPLDAFNNPKLKALIQLVRDKFRPLAEEQTINCIRDVHTPPYVEGLLDGRLNLPWPDNCARKFLIFTMHPESTHHIAFACESLKIPFCVLRGTRAQKDEAVRLLREEVGIMLVTSAKDCGGLNLPFVSHIVFYHHILDRNIEAQVAARGQRLGREGNLEIITLINEAEAEGLPGA